jgi:hypothetical protein
MDAGGRTRMAVSTVKKPAKTLEAVSHSRPKNLFVVVAN